MNTGDIVTRSSYNHDIPFIIEQITDNKVILSGLHCRLLADAPTKDLQLVNTKETPALLPDGDQTAASQTLVNADIRGVSKSFWTWSKTSSAAHSRIFPKEEIKYQGNCFVKILHIDGNRHYLKGCLSQYRDMLVPTIGVVIEESKQPMNITGLLAKYRPNILVITGHDSIRKNCSAPNNVSSYLNSKYFIESVKIARNYNRNYDELVIITGGCQSYYQALIEAGANFASSPNRVFINVDEPAIIACKIATTSMRKIVNMDMIASEIPSGISGFGGVETRGQCREIKPTF